MKNKGLLEKLKLPLGALIYIVLALIVKENLSGHLLRVTNLALINAIAVIGIIIMVGYTGMISFAGITFFGVGAYVVANLTTNRFDVVLGSIPSLILAVIISSLFGYIIGKIILRLHGAFFTFCTIALVQIFHTIFTNYAPLFGGSRGIMSVPTFSVGETVVKGYSSWFILAASVLGVCVLIALRIKETRVGRCMASVRDDEVVAATLGIDVMRTKITAFTLSAAFAGLSGGLYAMQNSYVGSDMFNWNKSVTMLVMATVGGVASPVGAVIGAVLVSVLPEMFRSLNTYFRLAYGVTVILLMIFAPDGIVGITKLIPKLKKKLAERAEKKGAATNG